MARWVHAKKEAVSMGADQNETAFRAYERSGRGRESETLLQLSIRFTNLGGYTNFKPNNFNGLRQAKGECP